MRWLRISWLAVAALGVAGAVVLAAGRGLPVSELRVLHRGSWVTWWRSRCAPDQWSAEDPLVAGSVLWRPAAAGMERGELRLAGTGEAWRLLVVLITLDPSRLQLELVRASRDAGTLPTWSLADRPAAAVLALNAGQFTGGFPWGWLVRRGQVEQPPASGPLSLAVCVHADGRLDFIPAAAIPVAGSTSAGEAFQSYPVLLEGDGRVPAPLREAGSGVDLGHRDVRLAIGKLRNGRILIALTRFAAAGEAFGSLPFGPTLPETAAIVGALGCRQAVGLDGGISAQLAVRDRDGVWQCWRGWRSVPLALVGFARER